jgi:hypothetical protein
MLIDKSTASPNCLIQIKLELAAINNSHSVPGNQFNGRRSIMGNAVGTRHGELIVPELWMKGEV